VTNTLFQPSTRPVPADKDDLATFNVSLSAVSPRRRDSSRSSPGVEALLRRPPLASHRFRFNDNPVQTMSMVSVIAAIFVSISLSAAIVITVVCCRHSGRRASVRHRRHPCLSHRGRRRSTRAVTIALVLDLDFSGR